MPNKAHLHHLNPDLPPRGFGSVYHYLKKRPHHLLLWADVLALATSGLLLLAILNGLGQLGSQNWEYAVVVGLSLVIYLVHGFTVGIYDWRRYQEQVRQPFNAVSGVAVTVGVLLSIGFMFKLTGHFSRLWVGAWFGTFGVYILFSRVFLAWYLSRMPEWRFQHRRAVVIGAGEEGLNIVEHIKKFPGHGVRIVGLVDDRSARRPVNTTEIPLLGTTACIKDLVTQFRIDMIIIAMPWSAFERVAELLNQLANWAVDVYLAPDRMGLFHANRPVYRIGGMHVLSLKDRPINDWSSLAKRAEDLLIAIPAVVVLSPLLALIALAIKLDSRGPVLFRQERLGFHNELIRVFKFRSMYAEQTDAHADRQTTRQDPRVTRVGRLIRSTSLDELPQLFNVIQGCMSIVGPRPHAMNTKAGDKLFQDAVDVYASRHRVKPGITGWAQCNGWRGETDTHEKLVRRVEHDLYYIDNWTLFLDILVILKTLTLLLKKDQNAY